MKKFVHVVLLVCLALSFAFAQKPTVVRPFGMTADKNKNLLGLTRTPSASNWNWQYWWVTSGLPVVPQGSIAYVEADTTKGTWALTSKPSGSNATITKITNAKTSVSYDSIAQFVADVAGTYIVSYTVGTKTLFDTLYTGVYAGVGSITDTNFAVTANAGMGCASTACHAAVSYWGSIVKGWSETKHAIMFWQNITGQTEFTVAESPGKTYGAAYRSTCAPCHTTGFNSGPTNTGTSSNGFFDLWKATSFKNPDTTGSWGQDGKQEAMFSYDGSRWKGMSNAQKQLGTIGCEVCHGPFTIQHAVPGGAWAKANMVSEEVSLCAQCHDSPNNHAVVQQYLSSSHGKSAVAKEERESWARSTSAKPTNCVKCHERAGFMNRNNPHGGATFAPVQFSDIEGDFTCVMCHQPHTAANKQARVVTNQFLNVSKMKLTKGGPGQLCVYCHQARRGNSPWGQPFSVETYIDRVDGKTKNDTIWTDALANFRYKGVYPNTPTTPQLNSHYGVAGDMLYGQSFYEFNEDYKASISGMETHADLEAGCATCHMAKPTAASGYSLLGYHTYNMKGPKTSTDATVGYNTVGCTPCHGEIKEFNEIQAANDYDGNGKIEGVQSEIQGMLDKLENQVFVQKWGLTYNATTPRNTTFGYASWNTSDQKYKDAIADSTKVKILFNYNSMYIDRSKGVHNAKYAVHVLARSLLKGGVAKVVQDPYTIPNVYELSNNYPNPFNPTTNIDFNIPKDAPVKVQVYDAAGRLVSTLADSYFQKGKYTISWDGKSSTGTHVASGVYYFRMTSNTFVETKKMMLMK